MCAPTSVMGSLTAWPLLKGVTVWISRRNCWRTRAFFFFSVLPPKTTRLLLHWCSPLRVRGAVGEHGKEQIDAEETSAIEYMTQKYRSAPDNCCKGYKVNPPTPPPSSLRLTCRGMRQSHQRLRTHLSQKKQTKLFFFQQLAPQQWVRVRPPPCSSGFRVAIPQAAECSLCRAAAKKQFSKCRKYVSGLSWDRLLVKQRAEVERARSCQ